MAVTRARCRGVAGSRRRLAGRAAAAARGGGGVVAVRQSGRRAGVEGGGLRARVRSLPLHTSWRALGAPARPPSPSGRPPHPRRGPRAAPGHAPHAPQTRAQAGARRRGRPQNRGRRRECGVGEREGEGGREAARPRGPRPRRARVPAPRASLPRPPCAHRRPHTLAHPARAGRQARGAPPARAARARARARLRPLRPLALARGPVPGARPAPEAGAGAGEPGGGRKRGGWAPPRRAGRGARAPQGMRRHASGPRWRRSEDDGAPPLPRASRARSSTERSPPAPAPPTSRPTRSTGSRRRPTSSPCRATWRAPSFGSRPRTRGGSTASSAATWAMKGPATGRCWSRYGEEGGWWGGEKRGVRDPPSPSPQQVVEFESTALMAGSLGVRLSMVAYPIVSVRKVREGERGGRGGRVGRGACWLGGPRALTRPHTPHPPPFSPSSTTRAPGWRPTRTPSRACSDEARRARHALSPPAPPACPALGPGFERRPPARPHPPL